MKTNSKNSTQSTDNNPIDDLSTYPKHPIGTALRIPTAIYRNHDNRDASIAECARLSGTKNSPELHAELASAIKFGLLRKTAVDRVVITDLVVRILNASNDTEKTVAMREAVLNAPLISIVYLAYLGKPTPSDSEMSASLAKISGDDNVLDFMQDFKTVYIETLVQSKLDGIVDETSKDAGPDNSEPVPIEASESTDSDVENQSAS